MMEQLEDPAQCHPLAEQGLSHLPESIRGNKYMAIAEILASIDLDLAKLQQAKTLLSGGAAPAAKRKPGRPKKVAVFAPKVEKPAKKKRKLSPEGRKRIAEAVKKRWAAQKAGVK
jgi:hypothetical protein